MFRLFATFLRVLLSVALIFNGSGYAYAATQMHVADAQAVDETVERIATIAVHDASPCHAEIGGKMAHPDSAPAPMDSMAAHHGGRMDHDRTDLGDMDRDGRDCCQTDQCDCTCAQHAPATSLAFWTRSTMLLRGHIPAYQPAQHLSPALSHLQRPPIG